MEKIILPVDFSNVKPGDTVKRIYGDGFMESIMTVCEVDEKFIYCNAQNDYVLPQSAIPWKFDRVYGVETDEEMGWGVAYGLVLSRLIP